LNAVGWFDENSKTEHSPSKLGETYTSIHSKVDKKYVQELLQRQKQRQMQTTEDEYELKSAQQYNMFNNNLLSSRGQFRTTDQANFIPMDFAAEESFKQLERVSSYFTGSKHKEDRGPTAKLKIDPELDR
jgi:hypothetical protein